MNVDVHIINIITTIIVEKLNIPNYSQFHFFTIVILIFLFINIMLEIPFLTKLNTKVEPIIDCSSSFLYDKGENIYIPLDGKLTTD